MKKRNVNRLLAMILCFVMAFAMIACNGGEKATTKETSKNATVRLYLMKHGETILDSLNRVQGWSDAPLTDTGISAAKDTAAGLADIQFDYVYSSDRVRATETADIILADNIATAPLDVITMEGLREVNFGKYEGEQNDVMWGDIMKKLDVSSMDELLKVDDFNKKTIDTMAELDETNAAENSEEYVRRLMASVNTITENVSAQGGGNVLIVGHSTAISSILSEISTKNVGELEDASISEVEYTNGKLKVVSVGDTSYTEKGAKLRGESSEEVVIYLTRHGKTVFNTMDRVQGWIDSPLTDAGIEVAEKLGNGISDVKFSAIYTSDLGRTTETANLIMAKNTASGELKHTKLKNLREANYGSFEGGYNSDMAGACAEHLGISVDELMALPNMLEVFYSALTEVDESGNAESFEMLSARTHNALLTIAEESMTNGGGNVLVVSHGNAIMSILNSLGVTENKIANASVTKIIYKDGTFTVESVNDTSYIE